MHIAEVQIRLCLKHIISFWNMEHFGGQFPEHLLRN